MFGPGRNDTIGEQEHLHVKELHNFFLNNQRDALIILILFCYKTLRVSGIFSAHYQEFSAVHSALVSFMQVSDDRFQAESGWNKTGIISASDWLLKKKKSITMHGNMNVKLHNLCS
jgi:hypothetical protein